MSLVAKCRQNPSHGYASVWANDERLCAQGCSAEKALLTQVKCLQISIILGLLFAKTVYEELDVDAAMQHGLLPGALSLAGNFWPAIKAVSKRTCLPVICCTIAVRYHLATWL